LNLSTAEIAEQVRSGSADVGAMAGHPLRFTRLNPGMRILASSPLLPQSIVALSPNLSDLDRDRLQRALLNAPDSVRGQSAADFGPGATPDYRLFARQVAEGKVFSACLRNQAPELKLHCPASDRINLVEGWISHVQADGDRVLILLQTADHYSFSLVIDRALLEQIAMFQVLNDLRGRFVRVLSLRPPLESQSLMIKTPHQLDIRP
jgi:hypothetical protein